MSELAERIKALRLKTWGKVGFDTNDDWYTAQYDALIEQALLAERRLAMEACASLPLEGRPDHPEENGTAAHLRTEIRRSMENL